MSSVKRNRNINQEFAQLPDLCIIFGVSSKFFTDRVKKGLLLQNIHFFPQVINEKSDKKAILWDVEAVRQFVMANPTFVGDDELQELLSRAKV